MTATTWTCPTCRAAVVTRYCPTCGERPLEHHELTLRGLATQIFNALTSVDGRLLRTFARLMRRPGDLTVALLLACAVYMYVASRKVYGTQGVARAAQVVVLTIGVGAVVLGYRFWLFALTLYTT